MKATSLSISIPADRECNKKCPYCISNMTKQCYVNEFLWTKNLDKVRKIAEMANVNSIIITGKSEPLLEINKLFDVADVFKEFPLELQTNGLLLDKDLIDRLSTKYINTIAISIDNINQLRDLKGILLYAVKSYGFNIRLTFNLTKKLTSNKGVETLFNAIHNVSKTTGVSQISFRDITIPHNMKRTDELAVKTCRWIQENVDTKFNLEFIDFINRKIKKHGSKVCSLPFGATIYMYDDISYTHFDYCIQDETNNEDIRSLIYFDDGHLSRSWNGSNYGRII